MATHDPELADELGATLRARKDLGPDYEAELTDAFLEKLERTVDQRVRRGLAQSQLQVARSGRQDRGPGTGAPFGDGTFAARFGFVTVSLVLAVPLSAIAVVNAGLTGLLVCWAGIVGVNAAHSTNAAGLLRPPRHDNGA
ncbi:hypothetical protein [Streptomyces pinistramenti]|uniref:hypothetical protein n=1 Tax=Streptomyces pinistramenti TaxID=2884812 RepID=UPI001D086F76|nr:hypothetical protein [Streptomyces pinistramenti]MCB5907550.1 hypothetical protein [Streptomyces pinistramenti]